MNEFFAMNSNGVDVSWLQPPPMASTERDGLPTSEASRGLLRPISEVLDIRGGFPRVSEIANHALRHDALALVFLDEASTLTLEAHSDAFPVFRRIVLADEVDCHIVNDLRLTRPRFAMSDPPDFTGHVIAEGYRSLLVVRSQARQQPIGLMFLSRQSNAFVATDAAVARQIAGHVALAVSRDQLADGARQRVKARESADGYNARLRSLTESVTSTPSSVPVIGQTAEWRSVLKKALQVASTETTVCLQGESGTGKEVIAHLIHRASARQAGPFVAINCAALPEHLLESELFGYERGAFTGAQQSKPGQIEMASGGVLFLDEVSEMLPAAQAKFLRVLQEREFFRLGGTRLLKSNVRVVAATNQDLRDAVRRGAFREDLYYRLQVFDIELPPLRDRGRDIPLFIETFLQDIGRSMGARAATVAPEAKALLLAHTWPGNVRELRNVLERAAILCDGECITPQHLSLNAEPMTSTSRTTNLKVAEKRAIERILHETDGNKAKTARRLGLTRTQLYVRLRKYDVDCAPT